MQVIIMVIDQENDRAIYDLTPEGPIHIITSHGTEYYIFEREDGSLIVDNKYYRYIGRIKDVPEVESAMVRYVENDP